MHTTVARKRFRKTNCLNVKRTVSENVGLTASLNTHSTAYIGRIDLSIEI